MFQNILKRDDVVELLRQIAENNRYNKKDELDSIDYSKYVLFQQSLFIVADALYKYSVIVDDEKYIKNFVEELNLLIKKIDNFNDISIGVCKLITKFTVLKLGYKDKEEENREYILNYIYNKYVTEGYLFHSISDVYKNDIMINGFVPQQYNNLYSEFKKVNDIVGLEVLDTDFSNRDVSFTDSFLNAYYYAINSPMYFYNILCNNSLITKVEDKSAYMKNDYDSCFKNLNKIIYKLDLNNNDSNKLKDICNREWNLINRSNYCPTVMVVKRSLLLNDQDIKYDFMVNRDIELYEVVSKIISSKYDDIKCDFKINPSDIEFITLFKYSDLVKEEKKKISSENREEDNYNNQYGKVSLLLLSGALLIALGVIITMIMIVVLKI